MAKARKPDSAIALLMEDHEYVKKAFRAFEKMDEEDQPALVKQVCQALKVHTKIEEEIFYPAVRRAIKDEDLMNEAEVEHDSAKALIRQLASACWVGAPPIADPNDSESDSPVRRPCKCRF